MRLAERAGTPRAAAEPRIVIIEDSEDDASVLRRTLAKSGVEASVEVLADGAAALEAVERWGAGAPLPSLVVLDLGLPRVPGIEVLRRMRAPPEVGSPVVVLTGDAGEEQHRACVALGVHLYLTKPVSLVDIVYVLLGIHRYWQDGRGR